MYAVCVTFKIRPGHMGAFMTLMQENARISLRDEPGCHQFDVLSDTARPDVVFLYELYTDKSAFQAHLASAHFDDFDAATAHMIAGKDVATWNKVTS